MIYHGRDGLQDAAYKTSRRRRGDDVEGSVTSREEELRKEIGVG